METHHLVKVLNCAKNYFMHRWSCVKVLNCAKLISCTDVAILQWLPLGTCLENQSHIFKTFRWSDNLWGEGLSLVSWCSSFNEGAQHCFSRSKQTIVNRFLWFCVKNWPWERAPLNLFKAIVQLTSTNIQPNLSTFKSPILHCTDWYQELWRTKKV